MPKRAIHLICQNDERDQPKGLVYDRNAKTFKSGSWDLSVEDAALLVGGWLYLHATKASGSYYGGVITGFEKTIVDDAKHTERIVFTFQPKAEAKGRKWRGQQHGPTWTGRIIDASAAHEMAEVL
jgi:hypothetical protein